MLKKTSVQQATSQNLSLPCYLLPRGAYVTVDFFHTLIDGQLKLFSGLCVTGEMKREREREREARFAREEGDSWGGLDGGRGDREG